MFLAFSFLPFAKTYHDFNFVDHRNQPITFFSALSTWDGQHYLYLSEQGYKSGLHTSNAFSPLFPFTIYLTAIIIRNNIIAGLLAANIASFIGFYLFFLLVKRLYNADIAYQSLIFLLAFPTSFYFSLMYSESLFFCLAVALFYFLTQKKLFFASLCAFFLPLVRLFGIAVILPYTTYYFHEINGVNLHTQVITIGKLLMRKTTLFLLSPLLAFAVTLGLMYELTGNPFEQFTMQKYFLVQYSVQNLLNPFAWFKIIFFWPLALHGFTNSVIDRIFFVLFLIVLYFLYKKVSFSFFLYALVMGLLPVLSGSFMSYTRHLIVVFPIFMFLGIMSKKKSWEPFVFPLLYIMLLLQGLFLTMHTLNFWVA